MLYGLFIAGRDDHGRVLARMVEDTLEDMASSDPPRGRGIHVSDRLVALMPELGSISADDRGSVKTPVLRGDPMPDYGDGSILVSDGVGVPDPLDPASAVLQVCGPVAFLDRLGPDSLDRVAELVSSFLDEDSKTNMRHYRRSLKGGGGLDFEASAVRAEREPHEALVAAWRKEDGTVEDALVGHRGAMMFWESYANGSETHCLPDVEGPGLWLLENGETWTGAPDYETGIVDSWGVSGTYRAVTPEEAAAHFGRTVESLLEEITELYPFHLEVPLMEALALRAGEPGTGAVPDGADGGVAP